MAEAIYAALVVIGLQSYVIGFTYDTTMSNTGVFRATAVLLNNKFEKNRLFFECRHHVAELFGASVNNFKRNICCRFGIQVHQHPTWNMVHFVPHRWSDHLIIVN